MFKQEGLAVARIARDDGSSAQTVLQMGMTNYQPLRSYAFYTQLNMVGYKLCNFPLRTLYRVLYIGHYAVYVRCGTVLGRCGPMW